MFRNIQDRFARRLENIKNKTQAQTGLEKNIRSFLVKEFGPIGETLIFKVFQENKKVHIKIQNKTAANELALRSGKLRESLRVYDSKIKTININ